MDPQAQAERLYLMRVRGALLGNVARGGYERRSVGVYIVWPEYYLERELYEKFNVYS